MPCVGLLGSTSNVTCTCSSTLCGLAVVAWETSSFAPSPSRGHLWGQIVASLIRSAVHQGHMPSSSCRTFEFQTPAKRFTWYARTHHLPLSFYLATLCVRTPGSLKHACSRSN